MSDSELFLKLKIFRKIFFTSYRIRQNISCRNVEGKFKQPQQCTNNSKQKSKLAFISSLQLNFDEIKLYLQNPLWF